MTVYYLPPHCLGFPDPEEADPEGLLAVGGDLSVERLVAAYAKGIFPWYGPENPILWWSPDPRPILEPGSLHVPRSLKRVLNRGEYEVTLDRAFEDVVRGCAGSGRPQGEGTWLGEDMIQAYLALHRAGLAHSAEAWSKGELAGGLYGVALGRAFFGESMFHSRPDASKAALVRLVKALARWEFHFIDCQQATSHMLRFGAREIPRKEFNARLEKALREPTLLGRWVMPDF